MTHHLFTDEENILSETCTWRDLLQTVRIPPTPKSGLSFLHPVQPHSPMSNSSQDLEVSRAGKGGGEAPVQVLPVGSA